MRKHVAIARTLALAAAGVLISTGAAQARVAHRAKAPVAQPPVQAPQETVPYSSLVPQDLAYGDFFVAGRPTFEIAPVGGQTVQDRARILAQNLQNAVSKDGKIQAVTADMVALRSLNGLPVIYIGEVPIITVTDRDAELQGLGTDQLAAQWAANLGTALAFLPVGHAVPPDLLALKGSDGQMIALGGGNQAQLAIAAVQSVLPGIANQLDVQAQGTVIYLNGAVNTLAQKDQVATAVASVPGVTGIVNTIHIVPLGNATDAQASQQAQQILASSTQASIQQLAVNVSNGTAVVSGAVPTIAIKKRAAELLATIDGITGIDTSRVTISTTPVSDAAVKSRIAAQLGRQNVQASVDNGVVTLQGVVNTLAAKDQATRTAERTPGVRAVDNRIQVQPPSGS